MSKAIEKVFIVWGGNQDIAKLISNELIKHGFDGIVGGGTPTDLYIGTQVFSQIQQCTRAIILVENTRKDSINPFSSNLMFEWGYLTAKLDPRKLHVFLIGESVKNLPSDLAGIWAEEIKVTDEKTREIIALEIANMFFEAASRPIDIDKIGIFYHWNEIKRNLSIYSNAPTYSEIECAHYLLHSIEVCYGYMEENELIDLIKKIVPASTALEFAIQIVKSNIALFGESSGLTNKISFDTFSELKSLFERKFDFSNQDRNLHLWFKYFCSCRLGLLYMFIVRDNDFDEEYKNTYFQKADECFNECLQTLNEIAEKYPQEAIYTKLYEGYIYRDLFRLNKSIGDMEKTFHFISAASKSHEAFYLYYKQRYQDDGYLIKHFGKEYYLDYAERLKFVKDPIERKIAENTIRSFLEKLETDSGRQHVVLNQLRSAFEDKV
jgi:hypothetical protein